MKPLFPHVLPILAAGIFLFLPSFAHAGEPVADPAPAAGTTHVSRTEPVIRIKAGVKKPLSDADGNVWLPDQGFVGGVIADRDVITPIANTNSPALFRSERYNMSSFSYPVPNGKYRVSLYFAEMYERVTGPGQRVFSFNVEGHVTEDFDVWAAAGGSRRAHIESVTVDVTDGKLDITFTPKAQFPTINAIEIAPAGEPRTSGDPAHLSTNGTKPVTGEK